MLRVKPRTRGKTRTQQKRRRRAAAPQSKPQRKKGMPKVVVS